MHQFTRIGMHEAGAPESAYAPDFRLSATVALTFPILDSAGKA